MITQFLTRKERGLENLTYALENYPLIYFMASPFSLGKERISFAVNDFKNEKLEIEMNGGMLIRTKSFHVYFPLKDYREGFKIEYQNEKNQRVNEDYSQLNEIKITTFRNVLDDFLVEIGFEGKINLEKDGKANSSEYYWKIKR